MRREGVDISIFFTNCSSGRPLLENKKQVDANTLGISTLSKSLITNKIAISRPFYDKKQGWKNPKMHEIR